MASSRTSVTPPNAPAAVTGSTRFPMKLHALLESTEKANHSHVISWLPDGSSFRVHDKHRFTSEVLPVFFGTSKYKSFQRNLNLWGFHTVSKGPLKGECSHPLFKKGLPDLCRSMERVAVKGNGSKRGGEQADPSNNSNAGSGGGVGSANGTSDSANNSASPRIPSEISTSQVLRPPTDVAPQQQQQDRRLSTSSESSRLAEFLRQGGKQHQHPSHHEQLAATATASVAAGPNPLQYALLQRLQTEMAAANRTASVGGVTGNGNNINPNIDIARLLALNHHHQQVPTALLQYQQQAALLGGVPTAAAAAIGGIPGSSSISNMGGSRISPSPASALEHRFAPGAGVAVAANPSQIAAMLQMYPQAASALQPTGHHASAAASAGSNSLTANEAAIMRLLGASAMSRV